jgi:RNA polymerase sigma factor (sigma-70 family)
VSDSAPSLQLWLDRLNAGDPAARNELIRHSRDRLRLLTHQMLRNYPRVKEWEDTSDVLQNVLVRLDRALRAITIPTARDFLKLAAVKIRQELIDISRRITGPQGDGANRVPPGNDPRGVPEPADNSGDPYRLALWREFHDTIVALGDEDREMFELLYYQGLTQPEAAALVGKPLKTFKTHWRNAKLRLMTRLGGELPIQF